MKEYLLLQGRMIARRLAAYGLHPLVSLLLLPALFIGGSMFLFYKTEFAPYVYLLIALAFIQPLSGVHRNEFLEIIFPKAAYTRLRIAENLLMALPFLLFLVFKCAFLAACMLVVLSLTLAFIVFRNRGVFVIPTPFSRQPYEFAVGFRKSWYLIALAYLLTVIAVIVGNFNLGAFALIFIFLISLSFYGQPEQEYLVWIHSLTPVEFLWKKIRIAVLHSTILSMPVLLLLLIFYHESWLPLLFIQGVGYLALSTLLLARYSAFPDPISVPQGIMLALSIQLPVLLVMVLPYFYFQSINKLKKLLR